VAGRRVRVAAGRGRLKKIGKMEKTITTTTTMMTTTAPATKKKKERERKRKRERERERSYLLVGKLKSGMRGGSCEGKGKGMGIAVVSSMSMERHAHYQRPCPRQCRRPCRRWHWCWIIRGGTCAADAPWQVPSHHESAHASWQTASGPGKCVGGWVDG
jgi:hypothetical protein